MADVPRKGSTDRTVRSHGEQIRRLRTRTPIGSNAITYQVTNADVNAAGGWHPEGYPFPVFVRQGDMCFVSGMFAYYGSATPSPIIIPTGVIPGEFVPNVQRRLHANGNGFTTDHFWTLLFNTDGSLRLATAHTNPATFPYGYYLDGGDDHVLSIIGPPYPARELGLGDIPP